MASFSELGGSARRQLIDTQQTFDALRHAQRELRQQYCGSMRWAPRNGKAYLLRKLGRVEKSLGARNADTERIFETFHEGRRAMADRVTGLRRQLEVYAPINVAMGLGRVPSLTARLLRRLDEGALLDHVTVLGTNALFAYEVRAGGHVMWDSGKLDGDLDGRRRLRLRVENDKGADVLGVIGKVDQSFNVRAKGAHRANNRDGYVVDLIHSGDGSRPDGARGRRHSVDRRPADLTGDLDWLWSAPRFTAISIDEKGFPVAIETIDPRAFALLRLWQSDRPDRDPLKRERDRRQAALVAGLAVRHLGLSFDAPEISLSTPFGAPSVLPWDEAISAGSAKPHYSWS